MNYNEKSSSYRKFIVYAISFIVYSLSFIGNSYAQQYPVQVIPQLVPPYTTTISQYYSGASDKLAVTLINTDLTKPTLNVRLRMYIESQSVKLRSREGAYYPTITLDAGVPLRISQGDLAPYFNVDNLDLQGMTRLQYTQQGKLPEGFYTFSFEVVEAITGRVVGRKTSAMAWITLSDPPLLNLPRKAESIAYREPQNIIFQWTPRNMSSPNSAFNTEYEFTLVEVWDNGIAPEAAFGMAQPLYRTTTRATTLLYGPSEPPLLPGKRYAWRIQAKSTGGMEETDSYRNGGYSEIYWFSCQSDCQPVLTPMASVSGSRASVSWTVPMSATGAFNESAYVIEYREKGQDKATWYSTNPVTATTQNIYELKKDKTYEYRVGRYCGVAVNTLVTGSREGAVYTDIKTFVIDGNSSDSSLVNCGKIPPATNISNQTLIQTLHTGDIIMAGDFPITLTRVSGNGNFTGEGYVTIPMLGQARVKVRFSGIGVNTDMRLISGVIETTYDKNENQIANLGDVAGQLAAVGEVVSELVKMSIDRSYAEWVEMYDKLKKEMKDDMEAGAKERLSTALENMNNAKLDFDAAKEKYDNATTTQEKEEAKKAMDEAEQKFEEAKSIVSNEISGSKFSMTKEIKNIIRTALTEIGKEINDEKIAEEFKQAEKYLGDYNAKIKANQVEIGAASGNVEKATSETFEEFYERFINSGKKVDTDVQLPWLQAEVDYKKAMARYYQLSILKAIAAHSTYSGIAEDLATYVRKDGKALGSLLEEMEKNNKTEQDRVVEAKLQIEMFAQKLGEKRTKLFDNK